jgi:CO/xanthine dehydrogenase FAD-binding subunit
VAAFLTLDGLGGVIEQARIVLGAVAPTPIRALSAEQALVGERPSEDAFARAGTAAAHDSKPIDDFRGSAEYRRDMVEVLTRRALNLAYKEANR